MDLKITKIGVIANSAKKQAIDCLSTLTSWASGVGLTLFLEETTARGIGTAGYPVEIIKREAALVVVIGGDGTLLRAARLFKGAPLPILGINLGAFGYLTEFKREEMTSALELIVAGQYKTEKRMMLDVIVRKKNEPVSTHSVLNDVVINRGNLSRMVSLEAALNGEFLTTYRADGLIVSTPTGSTAYSLSAGGPIVLPTQELIILNPICPHTLTNRPIILPPTEKVTVTIWTKEKGATLTLDGQESFILASGDCLEIFKSPYATKLVISPERDYLEILRSKLGWGKLPQAPEGKTDPV